MITHGHEDHLGALPWMIRDLGQDKIPVVYSGQLTIAMARSKLDEHKLRDVAARGAADRRRRRCRPVRDRAHPPHALDPGLPAASRSRPPLGTVLFTGDYKFDQTPVGGAPADMARLAELGRDGLLLLCGDSTNVDRPGISRVASRSSARTWTACSRRCEGRIVVTCFASNIHRVQQVVHAAEKPTAARSRWSGARCARTSTSAAASGTSTSRRGCWCRRARSTSGPTRRSSSSPPGSQGEPLSALRRMAYRDHPQVELKSRRHRGLHAPRRSRATSARSTRRSTGSTTSAARSSPPRDAPIHASGHGYAEEVKMMINLTRPKYVMPVHGDFKRMLIHGRAGRGRRRPGGEHLPHRERHSRSRSTRRRALRRAGAGRA